MQGTNIPRTKHHVTFSSLSGMPDGTTSNAQVANACLPSEERPNKASIFISVVSDTRFFLAWLRAS